MIENHSKVTESDFKIEFRYYTVLKLIFSSIWNMKFIMRIFLITSMLHVVVYCTWRLHRIFMCVGHDYGL